MQQKRGIEWGDSGVLLPSWAMHAWEASPVWLVAGATMLSTLPCRLWSRRLASMPQRYSPGRRLCSQPLTHTSCL